MACPSFSLSYSAIPTGNGRLRGVGRREGGASLDDPNRAPVRKSVLSEELKLLAFFIACLASGVIGWCLHWLLGPAIEEGLATRRLKAEKESLVRKLDESRGEVKALKSGLAICHRERDVAHDAAAQLLELTNQAVDSITRLTDSIDPQGGGTEPLNKSNKEQ